MKQTLGVVVVVLLFGSLVSSAPAKKQLAGPPSEFSLHTLPNTTVGHLTSEYNSHFIYFKNSSDVMSWEADLTVDSTTNFAFFISTPHAKSVTVTLTNEKNGKKIPLPTPLEENFPIGMELVPTSSYRFGDTLPIGIYTLEIIGAVADIAPAQNPLEADGLVIAYNESPYKIYSNLISYRLQKGEKVGIRAMIFNSLLSSPQGDVAPRPVLIGSAVAELEIELPNGTDVTVDMHDDGLHDDLMANDGVYGATIVAPQAGRYIAEPKLLAQPKKGGPVLRRSTLQLFNVVDLPFSVTPTATGILSGDNKMKIYVPVGEEVDKTLSYRPYAEVWGKSVTGEDVAVCWISTLSPITDFGGAPNLELELDLNWVKMANAKEPLTLKNFYVQELNYFTPLVEGQTIAIKTKESIRPHVDQLVVTGITKEMRQGKAPIRATNSTKEKGKLVLVHGYCAERNPWQQSPEDWTDPAYFLNPKASISNDEFAKKVADFAENFESFSYLGHSQGGMVGVHLHNFYFTGLENSQGGRTVQSLGTPYQGNTVAGVGASLAGIFGVACGSNDDLTKDGAELWLKGITTETRKDVYYYTTTYPDSGAKYCVWALNLLLQKPNDGTSELALTALDGATNLGSTPGWCHTEGMKYTPQYYDHERNKAINAAAAR